MNIDLNQQDINIILAILGITIEENLNFPEEEQDQADKDNNLILIQLQNKLISQIKPDL